jgi:hypothetical protein
MALGESQDWSWAASGCASRSRFVRFLYLFKASFMISWKLGPLGDEEEAVD